MLAVILNLKHYIRQIFLAKTPWSLWRSVTVPAARYAVMTAKGIVPYAVPSAWEYVFSDRFMHTRAFCADFEVYDQRSKCVHDAEVDLYVSILK